MKMHRRDFLRHSALASTSLLVPQFLQAGVKPSAYRSRTGKILIVIQLSGGNDGLNTIVPYQQDAYYRLRPTLAIPQSDVLRVSDDLGFHPELAPLRELYDEGLVSIVNNVGYPNPDRSHFRSMDIWQSASDSDEYLNTGWLGRYLDSHCPNPYHALELDDTLSLAVKGEHKTAFALSKAQQMRKLNRDPFLEHISQQNGHEQEEVAYLYKTLLDTRQSADYLIKQSQVHRSRTTYPNNEFGRDLKQIAELITADTDTRVYYSTMSGFDTHARQKGQQARLLKNYAEGVHALVRDLQSNDLLDDVVILTFSEFGRRVKQNGSGGTDHGTASNVWLMGGRLQKPGFYNDGPSLLDLDQGDLKYQIDFRRIYADLLGGWLEGDVEGVLGGYKGLGLV